jgi:cobalamin transport system substrate-binding protein
LWLTLPNKYRQDTKTRRNTKDRHVFGKMSTEMHSRSLAGIWPSLALVALTGIIAGTVEHFAAPVGGIRAAWQSNWPGSPAIRTDGQDYPRQAIDSDGFTVSVPGPARRIVSQYWSIDEYVYTVVPPERVIAVSESAYLPGISNVYHHVQRFRPAIATDLERVLRLSPDLLIVSNSSRADYCAIVRSAGMPIYRAFTMFTTLEELAETIRLTGYLTAEDRAAEEEVKRFWAAIEGARAKRPENAPRPRILGLSGRYGWGSQTVFDEIVRTLGAINVAAEGGLRGSDAVNSEQVVRWNPEWIVVGTDPGRAEETRARLLADPAIALTQAAREGHILVLENRVLLPLSPFTTRLAIALAEALYG